MGIGADLCGTARGNADLCAFIECTGQPGQRAIKGRIIVPIRCVGTGAITDRATTWRRRSAATKAEINHKTVTVNVNDPLNRVGGPIAIDRMHAIVIRIIKHIIRPVDI